MTALILALLLVVIPALVAIWLWPRYPYAPAAASPFSIERFEQNPIVHGQSGLRLRDLDEQDGAVNINGPSMIRVPDWIANPLGRYYLYFAHHKGDHIRLAYAEQPTGPWRIHEPGALSLADSGFPVTTPTGPNTALADLWHSFSVPVIRDFLILHRRYTVTDAARREKRGIAAAEAARPHIASPDVIIDHNNRRVLMFYHGMGSGGYQLSRLAVSTDGVHFAAQKSTIPATYLRAFSYAGHYYLLGMPGVLFRSADPAGPYTPRSRILFDPDMRHAGVWLKDSTLYVFWTRVGDAPERILLSMVNLESRNWNHWRATTPVEVMRPVNSWEGSDYPLLPSLRGESGLPAQELRDPYVFEDSDGALFLLYAGAGEQAIGIARLHFD